MTRLPFYEKVPKAHLCVSVITEVIFGRWFPRNKKMNLETVKELAVASSHCCQAYFPVLRHKTGHMTVNGAQ